ncbi:MAG: ribbon-helix-helix protein, CopG family [Acidobacteriota bacterium]
MTLSVRLDDDTKRLLLRLARVRRISQSELVRRAIHALAKEGFPDEETTLYDRIKDVIGKVHSGRSDLSQQTGEDFRQILLEKKRAGRL